MGPRSSKIYPVKAKPPTAQPEMPSGGKRATIRDVAAKSGLSIATVSRAMNRESGCAAETRRKVLRIAKQLGYVADPFVSALAQYRTRDHATVGYHPVVWLVDSKTGDIGPVNRTMIEEATLIGENFGYHLSVIHTAEYGKPAHCARILYGQGVEGIILNHMIDRAFFEAFDWSCFCVVSSLQESFSVPFDSVREHYFRSLFDSWQTGIAHGHRRIGTVLPSSKISRQNETLASATAYFRMSIKESVPDLIQTPDAKGSTAHYEKELLEWYAKYRPTLVIGKNDGSYYGLRQAGYRCPEDFSFVSLRTEAYRKLTGFRVDVATIARNLIEKLDTKIRRRQLGPSKSPTSTLVPSLWSDGETLSRPGGK